MGMVEDVVPWMLWEADAVFTAVVIAVMVRVSAVRSSTGMSLIDIKVEVALEDRGIREIVSGK